MIRERKSYDLVVLGGGPAGIIGAVTAANHGATVALVDSHAELGGAGVNTGTVPSKTLRETALALSGFRSRNLYGVDLSLRREATVADFLRHERNVKHGLNSMLAGRLESSSAEVLRGYGSFAGPNTVLVRGAEEIILNAGHVLIATGSSPLRPPIFPFDWPGVFDSDGILALERLPKKLAVIGGGVIGSEYACTFAALGAEVHLIDGRDVLLPFLDGEISSALANAMQRGGIQFHWRERVESCRVDGTGEITLGLSSGGALGCDAVLVAAGRKSNTGGLNLAAAGLAADDRGLIRVDEQFRTAVPHIYAAGDVIGFPALASTSMQQARLAMAHAFGETGSRHTPPVLPAGIYTIPEVGTVGDTEESLRAKGVYYVAGRWRYSDNARGRIIGDADGFLKLLFRCQDMKLMGAHAIGEQASELVHIGMMAMLTNSSAELFADACFNVPTLGELYKTASLDAMSQLGTSVPADADPESEYAFS